MLIQFSVSNFRSFREKQTLSMVAAPKLRRRENTFEPSASGEKLPRLLKVAAVYGPNASGKSNLLMAFHAVEAITRQKPAATIEKLPVSPFRFDPLLANKPSRFEVTFLEDGLRYEFRLAATEDRIIEERLVVFPEGRETLLYERSHSGHGEDYKFGDALEGDKMLHETWRKLTGPRLLFLAQAVANSSEELQQLRSPLNWMSNNLRPLMSDTPLRAYADATHRVSKRVPNITKDLSSFIHDLDIPITEVRFDTVQRDLLERLSKLDSNLDESRSPTDESIRKTTLVHKTALGEALFDFEEESIGTQNLFGFFLPWAVLASEAPSGVSLLSVDELDSSLHPQIVAELLRRHMALDKPKQLIFTTHDTHLMDTKLLRRDQIWLTERDLNGATQLRSIYEFEGRESEDVEKRYYEGRYRGLPILRRT